MINALINALRPHPTNPIANWFKQREARRLEILSEKDRKQKQADDELFALMTHRVADADKALAELGMTRLRNCTFQEPNIWVSYAKTDAGEIIKVTIASRGAIHLSRI